MEERERMLDTIMEMQEWNIKKDHQIELLNKRWEKLKEWLDKDITNGEWYFKVRNKMQELEQEKL